MEGDKITVGVVGLGLMGSSIAACLLLAGHPVVGVAPVAPELEEVKKRIWEHLESASKMGLTDQSSQTLWNRIKITTDYGALNECRIISENTVEDLQIKISVFKEIENNAARDAILTSNTSAIPISLLQKNIKYPERFLGLHWMAPAYTNRFLEIICGEQSDIKLAEYLYQISRGWNKEPTLVRKDIRGFITNRLMYAMYREACNLVENGYASVADVDNAIKNSTGHWLPLMGVFRWMDLTGLTTYHAVMKELIPTLNNDTEVPKLIDDIVRRGGKGIQNGSGFYEYSDDEAEMWKNILSDFSFEIMQLTQKYPADIIDRKIDEKAK